MKKLWVSTFSFIILMVTAVAWAAPVPDTGQTKCYNVAGNVITCPSPGQALYGQDANYSINPMSYTKLDGSGNALSDSATSWVTVRDNVTGLIWEMKTNKDYVTNYKDPHDADNTYTWYDSSPATNGGYAGKPGNGTTTYSTQDFINSLNSANYGGYSDWRLPTIEELAYIVNHSIPFGETMIDSVYFPNTPFNLYCSSTANANTTAYKSYVWSIDFEYGNAYSFLGKDNGDYVRAVRGEQSASVYKDNSDGTVTDTTTGLMWQQATSGNAMNWQDALSYCHNLNLGGHTDWRLPNFKELQSLVDYSIDNPSVNTAYFPKTVTYPPYWSATTDEVGAWAAWAVNFGEGTNTNFYKSSDLSVRAVRGGQATTQTACTANLNASLQLHIPYLSYNNANLSLSTDFVYDPNPSYPTLIPFKLTYYAILNNPSFSCAASTLSSNLTIHIPDVLFPDGVTHIWVDLTYNPALSTGGNFYWVVSNYGAVSN